MGFINRVKSLFKNDVDITQTPQPRDPNDVLLEALLRGEDIDRNKAMTLPAVSSAVDLISGIIASMPIKLYHYNQGKIEEIRNDARVRMLNGSTGDVLNAYEMKKIWTEDYLLDGNGYGVLIRDGNNIKQIKYVEPIYVAPYSNPDPIFKYVTFLIGTKYWKYYDVLKFLRNTKDGATGRGVVQEISKALETAFSTLTYQLGLVKTGGNKKGFLQSENKLSQDAIDKLKDAWRKMYANNTENVVVLNNGLKFQESSNSSVEMQLNESKENLEKEIEKVFHIHDDFDLTFKEAIYPIIRAFTCAINEVMLLESEKKNYFFEFDVKEIVKANIKERFEAYKLAKDIGMMTINEIRKEENMNSIEGMDIIPFTLASVLFDTETQQFYIPNTNATAKFTKSSNDNTLEKNKNALNGKFGASKKGGVENE